MNDELILMHTRIFLYGDEIDGQRRDLRDLQAFFEILLDDLTYHHTPKSICDRHIGLT